LVPGIDVFVPIIPCLVLSGNMTSNDSGNNNQRVGSW
jgi:hypothetical protein